MLSESTPLQSPLCPVDISPDRAALKILEQDFEALPVDVCFFCHVASSLTSQIIIQCLLGLFLSLWGLVLAKGRFLNIHANETAK